LTGGLTSGGGGIMSTGVTTPFSLSQDGLGVSTIGITPKLKTKNVSGFGASKR